MAFDDTFRLSAHAVITDEHGKVLQLKAAYGSLHWGLPGGSLEPEETIHEALIRECREEIGVEVKPLYMSGIYFHKAYNSHACIFRCEIPHDGIIKLSDEHSAYEFFAVEELSMVQKHRIHDCLTFIGQVKSHRF